MRACLALGFAVVALTGCGGSSCLQGVPCGPVPRYDESVPQPVDTTQRFASIAIGDWHSCMLTTAGDAWCWGSNEYGQLGAATTQRCMDNNVACSSRPMKVTGGTAFASLAASDRFTCALAGNGHAWCWGFGQGGQLGDGRRSDSQSPVAMCSPRWPRACSPTSPAD